MIEGSKPIPSPDVSAHFGEETSDGDSFDLRVLLRALARQHRRIIGLMLVSALVVYFLVSLMAPTYVAESKIILDVNKTRVTGTEQVVANVDPSEQIVNGEIQLLNSNILLDKVRQALPKAAINMLDPSLKEQSFTVRLKSLLNSLFGKSSQPGTSSSGLPTEESAKFSPLMTEIRNHLQIFSEKNSYVITIRASASDPDLARILANAVADTYINSQLAVRKTAIEQATQWLQQRVDALRIKLEAAESAVAEFESANLVRDGGTLENANQQLARLNTELIDTRSARLTAKAQLDELKSVIQERGLLAGAAQVTSTTMDSLRAQELDLKNRDAVWARSFASDHPKRVALGKELDDIHSAIEAEVRTALSLMQSQFEIAASREDNLRKNISTLEDKVSEMTQSGLGLRQLQRVAEATRTSYDALLGRLTEAQTQQQMQLPDSKLIARAVTPTDRSAPRPKLFALLAAVVAGTVATVAVFFYELTPTTFRSVREIELYTNIPVFAAVPMLPKKEAANVLDHLQTAPYGVFAERIRLLRSALNIGGRVSQSVMIASSVPGEGKSTLTISLAHMLVRTGSSVIVVDCDLRKPSLSRTLRLKPGKNFVDFIKNHCALDDAIDRDTGFGFDVLAPHEPFHDGADELSVTWLVPLIDELKLDYDVILVDSPPVLAVSDALTLAQMVDKRLYIVGFDSTQRAAVRNGLAKFREARRGIDGIVFSKVDSRRSSEDTYDAYGYY